MLIVSELLVHQQRLSALTPEQPGNSAMSSADGAEDTADAISSILFS